MYIEALTFYCIKQDVYKELLGLFFHETPTQLDSIKNLQIIPLTWLSGMFLSL